MMMIDRTQRINVESEKLWNREHKTAKVKIELRDIAGD